MISDFLAPDIMQPQGFHTAFLLDRKRRAAALPRMFGGAADEVPGKVRKLKWPLSSRASPIERFGPLAMLFGLMEVAGYFQRDGDLRRQGPGPANSSWVIPARSSRSSTPNMPRTSPFGIEQRDGQQLPHFELAQDLQVRARNFAGLVRPENFLVEQRLAGRACGEV